MSLRGLALQDAGNDVLGRLPNPFDQNRAGLSDLKSAHERNDFKEGFYIVEIINELERRKDSIRLLGDAMPHQPFSFGGTQKIVKDYYPGNPEPSVQVMGPREKDIVIKGRFKAKNIKTPVGGESTDLEEFRAYALEIQLQVEAMRTRGNLVRMEMGEFQRYGFIESAEFKLKTVADIDYEITFSIIGFNAPQNCRVLANAVEQPFRTNELLAQVVELQRQGGNVPPTVGRSFAAQITGNIAEIATAVSLVTSYVDTVLGEVDTVRNSVARALGLIKNARSQLLRYTSQVGGFDPFANASFDVSTGVGVADSYTNANYIAGALTNAYTLTGILERLRVQIAAIAATTPLGRHQVVAGDTLQKLSSLFYSDSSGWKEIFDHNRLQDTDLSLIRGEILEIPRRS